MIFGEHTFFGCVNSKGEYFIERESAIIKDEKRLNVNLAFILKWPPSHWQGQQQLSAPFPALSSLLLYPPLNFDWGTSVQVTPAPVFMWICENHGNRRKSPVNYLFHFPFSAGIFLAPCEGNRNVPRFSGRTGLQKDLLKYLEF